LPTPKFLTLAEVLALHEDQIASFGGLLGIRDQGLLESALAQPQATFGGQLLHPIPPSTSRSLLGIKLEWTARSQVNF
jgi:hypothetical protein